MACCLTAPSHYLNQCWLIIRGVLWHTSESSFAEIAQGIDSGYEFEEDILKNIFKSPRGQWVNSSLIEAERCIYASPNEAIIGLDTDLLPGRCQAIIWTNDGLLSIGRLQTYFSEILIKIHWRKCIWKCCLQKGRPSCLGLNVLTCWIVWKIIKDIFTFWILDLAWRH